MKFEDIYKKIEALDEALNEAASASINMSGDTAEDVIQLMKALKGDTGADVIKPAIKPMAPVMGPPEDDMAKLRDIVKGPDMDDKGPDMDDKDELKPGLQDKPCPICGKNHLGNSGCSEDYENEPDEKYQDHQYMTKDMTADGGDFGQKKSYAPTNGADNPMALEDELRAELAAKLKEHMSEGKGCGCNDGGDCQCDGDCEDCSCSK